MFLATGCFGKVAVQLLRNWFSDVIAFSLGLVGNMGAKYLSIHDKDKIILLHQTDMKPLDIALKMGKAKRTVYKVIQEFKNTGEIVGPKQKSGRPRVTSAREDRKLERIVKQRPFKTQNQYRDAWKNAGTSVSKSTVQRRIRKSGYKHCVAKRRPMLKKFQRRVKRVKWAKQHRFLPRNYWNRVLWSDESFF